MATVTIGGRSYEVEVRGDTVVVDGQEFPVKIARGDAYDTVTAGGVSYRVALPPEGERESGMAIEVDHRPFTLEFEGRLGGGPARPRQGRRARLPPLLPRARTYRAASRPSFRVRCCESR